MLSAITGSPEQCLVGSVTHAGGQVSGDVNFQLPEAFMANVGSPVAGPKRDERYPRKRRRRDGRLAICSRGVLPRPSQQQATPAFLNIQMELQIYPGAKTCRSDWTCEGHLLRVVLQFNFKSR